MLPDPKQSASHETQLLYYVFCVAGALHVSMLVSDLLSAVEPAFYRWELMGLTGSLIGLLLWRHLAQERRRALLLIPVTICVSRWVVGWLWGGPQEVYTSTISMLLYFPVLVGCAVLFGVSKGVGLGFSALLAISGFIGGQRPELAQTVLGEWRLNPAILGAYVLYGLFFFKWRGQMTLLQEAKEREHRLNLTLQATMTQQLASRMSFVSQLSGEVAHEFNNLLNIIAPLCEFLSEDLKGSSSAQDIADIQSATERMRILSHELMSLTQTSRVFHEQVDLSALLEELSAQLAQGEALELSCLSIELKARPGELLISGGAQEIIKLIERLYNHVQSGDDSERVSLSLTTIGASQVQPPLEEVQRGEVAVITVGAHEGQAERGEGELELSLSAQGLVDELSLTAAYAIALRSGGTIRAQRDAEQRVSFKVYLPTIYEVSSTDSLSDVLLYEASPVQTASPIAEQREPQPSVPQSPSALPHILLVDDEVSLIQVLERGLRRGGRFEVTSTSSSLSALALLKEDAARYDLLVTDVRMPELSGPELIRAAEDEGIKLPLYLYITGHIDDQAAASLKVSPDQVLFKPFTPRVLRARVLQLLGE